MPANQDKSSHGGRRPGAGRKKGSLTQKTREVAEKAAAAGVTPLEVMLEAMNAYRENGDLEKAAGFAKDAAPYMHPKLAAVEHSGTGQNGEIQTENKWRVELVQVNGLPPNPA